MATSDVLLYKNKGVKMQTDPVFWALLTILAALQVADFVTTRIVLDRGGKEDMPTSRVLMKMLTVNGFLVVKSIAVVALGYYIGLGSLGLLTAVILAYALVIYYNLKSIK